MAKWIDGKAIAAEKNEPLKKEFAKLPFKAGLAVISVGEDPASKIYIRHKRENAIKIGIDFFGHELAEKTTKEDLLTLIDTLNKDPKVHGILLQLPLPAHLNKKEMIQAIDPLKDIDGLHPINAGKLIMDDETGFIPCTPLGIIKLLEGVCPEMAGKKAIVLGRSTLIGKPMALCLLRKGCTVTMTHSKTKNLAAEIKQADIVIAATGRPNLVTGEMLKPEAIVIDAGMTRLPDGSLTGDVDFESAEQVASFITPVPGGVGPMTILSLGMNLLKAAKQIGK